MINSYTVGDRVVLTKHAEYTLAGEVTNGFHTGKPPVYGHVPVQWDDGTRTYEDPKDIDYEYVSS